MTPDFTFIDKADIRRNGETRNNYGGITKTLAAAHAESVPCRIDYLRSRRDIRENVTAEAGAPLIFFPSGTDVKQDDILEITTRAGETLTILVISARNVPGFSISHIEVIGSVR